MALSASRGNLWCHRKLTEGGTLSPLWLVVQVTRRKLMGDFVIILLISSQLYIVSLNLLTANVKNKICCLNKLQIENRETLRKK